MTIEIAAILLQDGLTTGSIYVLLGIALVLVFSVTRVLLVPQGDFVAFSALSIASFESGRLPGSVWLLLGLGGVAWALELASGRLKSWSTLWRSSLLYLGVPLALAGASAAVVFSSTRSLPVVATLGVLLLVALGPMLYRVVFEPLVDATPLTLLIVAIAVHFALNGFGLLVFGPEGARTSGFGGSPLQLGTLKIDPQSLWTGVLCVVLVVALYLFFHRTVFGKALRATAVNRKGAELVGISPALAGRIAFTLAAGIGAVSGALLGPITTLYYDSGFLLGLKGFVGAIIGGLAVYWATAAGALLVGVMESFSSFWASAYKEVLVFTLIIPFLLWRSLASTHPGGEE